MQGTNEQNTECVFMDRVCSAIRAGRYDEAMALLSEAQTHRPHNGYAWNLLGVVYECQRKWKEARRAYGKAIGADRRLKAAQQNMRRMYELYTFGRSREPLALGDHEMLLRKCLEDSLTQRGSKSTPF